jgi:hypothetical protein
MMEKKLILYGSTSITEIQVLLMLMLLTAIQAGDTTLKGKEWC